MQMGYIAFSIIFINQIDFGGLSLALTLKQGAKSKPLISNCLKIEEKLVRIFG